MQEHDGRPAAETASQNGAVVTAHELTRRYGEGDTAGIFMAILGAIVLLAIYRMTVGRRARHA